MITAARVDKRSMNLGKRRKEPHAEKDIFTCPCCGYPTLRSWAEYEICSLCRWEDDGQDDVDADLVRNGPNHSFSLVEAREKEVKRIIIEDYERIMEGATVEEIRRL